MIFLLREYNYTVNISDKAYRLVKSALMNHSRKWVEKNCYLLYLKQN